MLLRRRVPRSTPAEGAVDWRWISNTTVLGQGWLALHCWIDKGWMDDIIIDGYESLKITMNTVLARFPRI